MYRSSDVLAHFKGVFAFFEAVVQHASRQKEETIYCPCKVCKNNVIFKHHEVICKHLVWSGFMDNYFIWTKHGETQPRIESVEVLYPGYIGSPVTAQQPGYDRLL
jgi:hypothetical protein